jgi:hypothetical protein
MSPSGGARRGGAAKWRLSLGLLLLCSACTGFSPDEDLLVDQRFQGATYLESFEIRGDWRWFDTCLKLTTGNAVRLQRDRDRIVILDDYDDVVIEGAIDTREELYASVTRFLISADERMVQANRNLRPGSLACRARVKVVYGGTPGLLSGMCDLCQRDLPIRRNCQSRCQYIDLADVELYRLTHLNWFLDWAACTEDEAESRRIEEAGRLFSLQVLANHVVHEIDEVVEVLSAEGRMEPDNYTAACRLARSVANEVSGLRASARAVSRENPTREEQPYRATYESETGWSFCFTGHLNAEFDFVPSSIRIVPIRYESSFGGALPCHLEQ